MTLLLVTLALLALLIFAVKAWAKRPAHYSFWICVHNRESGWHDHGAPYFGGLQMGYWFMGTYGGRLYRLKGTADHWTPMEQIRVAERAYRREGYSISWLFHQWPNTAPPCV